MADTPYHVAHAFVAGRRDRAGEFVTDGAAVYSYSMRLAHKGDEGQVVYDYLPLAYGNKAPSVTTARHMRALESVCVPPKNDKRNPTNSAKRKKYYVGQIADKGGLGLQIRLLDYTPTFEKSEPGWNAAIEPFSTKAQAEGAASAVQRGSNAYWEMRRNPAGLTKEEFLQMLKANVKTDKWLNGTFEVEGRKVGVKAIRLWIQLARVEGYPYELHGTMYNKTQKAMVQEADEWLSKALGMTAAEAEEIQQRQAQAREQSRLYRNPSNRSSARRNPATQERIELRTVAKTAVHGKPSVYEYKVTLDRPSYSKWNSEAFNRMAARDWILRIHGTPGSWYMTTLEENPRRHSSIALDFGQGWDCVNFDEILDEAQELLAQADPDRLTVAEVEDHKRSRT